MVLIFSDHMGLFYDARRDYDARNWPLVSDSYECLIACRRCHFPVAMACDIVDAIPRVHSGTQALVVTTHSLVI